MSNEISIKVGDSSDLQLRLETIFLHIPTRLLAFNLKVALKKDLRLA